MYVDPYLSDYVERVEGPELRRLIPAPFAPDTVRDADWVLITHAHIDHCDPLTAVPIAKASPQSRFLGPEPVLAPGAYDAGKGSIFFREGPVRNYDDARTQDVSAFRRFFHAMLERGVHLPPSSFEAWFVSAALGALPAAARAAAAPE